MYSANTAGAPTNAIRELPAYQHLVFGAGDSRGAITEIHTHTETYVYIW